MTEQLVLIDPYLLKSHEKINPLRALWVLVKITIDGEFTTPILIDVNSGTILDGHHRRWAAKILGFKRIPCWSVDYLQDETVSVFPRRFGVLVNKSEIVRRAAAGNVYPHKTTRHKYTVPESRPFALRELRS